MDQYSKASYFEYQKSKVLSEIQFNLTNYQHKYINHNFNTLIPKLNAWPNLNTRPIFVNKRSPFKNAHTF